MPIFKQNTRFERGIDLAGPSKGEYIAKNWHTAQVTTDLGTVGFYQQAAQSWFTFGINGTTTPYAMSADGSDWYYRGAIGGFQVACALRDSHALGPGYLLIGGGLTTNTLYKIKRSPDLGTIWDDIQVTGSDDAMICWALAFTASGYFARLDSDVFWSPTTDSGSWNLVLTLPVPSNPNNLCTNGSLVIAYCNTGSTYFTTSSSASWSTRTFPNSFVVISIAYGKVGGAQAAGFLAVGSDATGPAAYYSFSGTSWSLLHRFASGTQFGSLAAMNEVFIGMIISAEAGGGSNVLYSPDGGITWNPATTVANYFGTRVEVATRLGATSPHQAGIFQDGFTKMTIAG